MHVYVPAHVLYVSVTGPAAIVTGASTGIGRSVAVALACKQFLFTSPVRSHPDIPLTPKNPLVPARPHGYPGRLGGGYPAWQPFSKPLQGAGYPGLEGGYPGVGEEGYPCSLEKDILVGRLCRISGWIAGGYPCVASQPDIPHPSAPGYLALGIPLGAPGYLASRIPLGAPDILLRKSPFVV